MRLAKSVLAAVAVMGLGTSGGMLLSAGFAPAAHAEALSNALQFKAKKLAQNIEKYRSSLAGQSAADLADDFKRNQMQGRVQNFAEQLAKFPDSDDPALTAAKQQYALLEQEFTAALAGAGAASAPAAAGQAASGQAEQPATSSATAPAQTQPQGGGPALVSGQRVRVKKLARDITGVRGDLVTEGPSHLQSAEVVAKYKQRVEQFAEALKRYADYKADPDVQAAAQEYQALRDALNTEFARAKAQLAELGDVQAVLTGLRAKMLEHRPPDVLRPPFSEDEAKQWVLMAAQAQKTAQDTAAELQRIAPLAYLPETRGTPEQGAPFDRRDLDSMFRFSIDTATEVNETLEYTRETLRQQFEWQGGEHELGFFRNLDPENPSHRASMFLREGAQEEVYGRLDKQMALAQSTAAFERALGKEPADETTARIAEIAALREAYAQNRRKALGDSRLPEPKSDDPERLAVAKAILAEPDYEFGEHGPIVLTTPEIVTREKEVSRDTIRDVDVSLSGTVKLSGTRESWHYKWDEFKFATPLKETDSDDWYIWWITAKKYESGWERTPIGTWISGAAVKGDLILPENFQ